MTYILNATKANLQQQSSLERWSLKLCIWMRVKKMYAKNGRWPTNLEQMYLSLSVKNTWATNHITWETNE